MCRFLGRLASTRASGKCLYGWLALTVDRRPCPGRQIRHQTKVAAAPVWASSATWPKLTRLPATLARRRPGSPAVSVLSNVAHSSWTLGCQHLAGFSGRCGELLQGFERQRRRCKPGRAEQPGAAVAHSAAAPGAPSGWTLAVFCFSDPCTEKARRLRGGGLEVCRWPRAGIC